MPVGAAGLAPRDPLNTASRGGLIGEKLFDLKDLRKLLDSPKSSMEEILKQKVERGLKGLREGKPVPFAGLQDGFEAAPSRAPSLGPVSRQRSEEPPPEPPRYEPPSKEYGRETGRPVDK
jgi:hypothetical protein